MGSRIAGLVRIMGLGPRRAADHNVAQVSRLRVWAASRRQAGSVTGRDARLTRRRDARATPFQWTRLPWVFRRNSITLYEWVAPRAWESSSLCSLPHGGVGATGYSLQAYVVHVMAKCRQGSEQRFREVLVQLDPHAGTGAAGVGRSSSAEAAAKAMTARTAGSVRVG